MIFLRRRYNLKPTMAELSRLQGRWRRHQRYNGLQLLLLLNENGGSRIFDSSSYARHLSLTNNASQIASRFGYTYDFAATAYLNITDTSLINLPTTHNFTVLFWSLNRVSSANIAIAWAGTDDLVLYPNHTVSPNVRVFWRDITATFGASPGASTTAFRHMAFSSYSPTDHRVFYNGVESATSTATGTAGPFSSLRIASWAEGGEAFNGYMDLIEIHSPALSPSEISSTYHDPFLPFRWASEQQSIFYSMPAGGGITTSASAQYYLRLVG